MVALSFAVLILTAANISSMLLAFLARYHTYLEVFLSLTCGLSVLLIVALFESYRRRGDALFEELSDEFLWNNSTSRRRSSDSYPESRPPLEIRLLLRSFTRAADLPMVPGRFGPAVYAAFNLLITLWTVLYIRARF